MPKPKGKKRRANTENISTQPDLPTDSGISGRSSFSRGMDVDKYFNSGDTSQNDPEPSPEYHQIESGISEIIKSCYEQLNSINQAKKQRMEQQVKNALQVSNAKVPFCPNLVDKRQNDLKELMPFKCIGDLKNEFTKTQADCEKGIGTIQKLMKNHQRINFENVLLNEVSAFQKRAEKFVYVVDKQVIEQQEQTIKMQQELKDEMLSLQKNVVKQAEASGVGNRYQSKLIY